MKPIAIVVSVAVLAFAVAVNNFYIGVFHCLCVLTFNGSKKEFIFQNLA
jgi:hypothetical protein